MTCRHFDDMVGYKGQKYQVVGDAETGEKKHLGWTNGSLKEWKFLGRHFGLENLRLEEVKNDKDQVV